jgi:hypothetical protein
VEISGKSSSTVARSASVTTGAGTTWYGLLVKADDMISGYLEMT